MIKEQRQHNGAKTSFSENDAKKKKERHIPYTFHKKIDSKLIIDLSVKFKTIKLLEDNTGENLDGLEDDNGFIDATPKPGSLRDITDKLDFIKI